jgi:hypothetical protein
MSKIIIVILTISIGINILQLVIHKKKMNEFNCAETIYPYIDQTKNKEIIKLLTSDAIGLTMPKLIDAISECFPKRQVYTSDSEIIFNRIEFKTNEKGLLKGSFPYQPKPPECLNVLLWDSAKTLIEEGTFKEVSQTHDLDVYMVGFDGKQYYSRENKLGEAVDAVKAYNPTFKRTKLIVE